MKGSQEPNSIVSFENQIDSVCSSQDMQDPDTMAEVQKMMQDPAFRECLLIDPMLACAPRKRGTKTDLCCVNPCQSLKLLVTRR